VGAHERAGASMGKRKGSKGEKDGAPPSAMSQLDRDFAVSGLPDYLEAQRTRVFCGSESNTSVSGRRVCGSSGGSPEPPMDEGPRRKMNSDARRLSFPKTRLACVLLRNRRSILVLRTHTPRRGSTTHRPGRSSNEAWTSESGGWMRRTTQWSSTSSACHPPLRTPCAAY